MGGETSERQDGAHTGYPEHTDTILNWGELNVETPKHGNYTQRTRRQSYWVRSVVAYYSALN